MHRSRFALVCKTCIECYSISVKRNFIEKCVIFIISLLNIKLEIVTGIYTKFLTYKTNLSVYNI